MKKSSNNIAVCRYLNNALLKKISRYPQPIEGILFLRLDPKTSLHELSRYVLYNAIDMFEVESGHLTYQNLKTTLNDVKEKIPLLFKFRCYDITIPLLKQLFWVYFDDGLLHYALQQEMIRQHKTIIFQSLSLKGNMLSCISKLLFYILQNLFSLRQTSVPHRMPPEQPIIGFRIEKFDVFLFYKSVIDYFAPQSVRLFQLNKPCDIEKLEKTGIKVHNVFPCSSFSDTSSPCTVFSLIKHTSLSFAHHFLAQRKTVITTIIRYEQLAEKGIRIFINNACEYDCDGYVMSMVAHQHGGKAINIQNGTKKKDAINQDTNFDLWLAHDKMLQNVICESGKLGREKVPITGHLLEYEARKHNYSGTLDPVMNQLKNKTVISVFSSHLRFRERMEVSVFLNQLCSQNEHLVVLYRPHPLEKRQENYKPFLNEKFILISTKDGDKGLFDQLLFSDIAISFGSMVAYQALWFGVPSISVEYLSQSYLSFIDNRRSFHVKSIEEMEELLYELLGQINENKKNTLPPPLDSPKIISDILFQYIRELGTNKRLK